MEAEMNILIAGGTGLIGRALTEKLIENGHQVWVLSRNARRSRSNHKKVTLLQWDAKTPDGWGEIMNSIDAVVNLAGSPLNGKGPLDIWLTKKRKALLLNSRLDSTNALLDAVEQADRKPSIFVQASAIGYYGPRGDNPIDENASLGEDFLANVQFQTEKESERAIALGMRRIVLRTGLVLDGQEGALQYFKLQTALFAGGRIGTGEQVYSWIHLEDEAAAIAFLLEQDGYSGVVNLTAPNPVTNQEFAKTLGKVMRRPSFLIIPGFVLKIILGEISTVILNGQRVVPGELLRLGYEFRFPELEPAFRDIQ